MAVDVLSAATVSRAVAARVKAPGEFESVECGPLAPGERQVVIALEGSGVCASSLPVWEGREWFSYPLEPGVPGHEGWGRIAAIGSGVTGFSEGDRVAFLSDRAFSTHALASADQLVRIPPVLDERDVPAEALACAFNIFRRSDVHAGQTVAIIGIGFLGALLCRLASRAGARVIAISRREFSLDLARRFGAAEVIPLRDHYEIVRKVRDLSDDRGCARVIEAVGMQWPLDLAGELVSEGGRLVIAGYHQDGLRQVNMQQWNWKGIDVINAHERDTGVVVDGMRMAIEAIASGEIDPEPLYTHRVPLDRLSDAFEMLVARPDGFVKALVVMR